MRIRFTKRFRWKATPQAVIRYEAGDELTVPRACVAAAMAAGAAELIKRGNDGEGRNDHRSDQAAAEA